VTGDAATPRPPTARAALGTRAEAAVVEYLRAQGIEILGTNVRAGRLEVDVLARDGEVVIVVEVRTRGRGAWQRALDSIDGKKQMRLRHAGERLWRERFARRRDVMRMRFDCASVTFDESGAPVVEYVRAAF
jgi:putative endonuclease